MSRSALSGSDADARPFLCFDTTGDDLLVGVTVSGRVTAWTREAVERGQSERLFPLLDGVLERAGLGWPDIGAIAAVAGPGSFTGVRVGVAAARGLGLSLGRPAIGVDGFDAYANAHARGDPTLGVTAICFGRPPRFAWRRYDIAGERSTPIDAEAMVGDADALRRSAAVFGGPAAALIVDAALPVPSSEQRLAAIGRLSGEQLAIAHALGESPTVTPVYLRPPDAEPSRTPPIPII